MKPRNLISVIQGEAALEECGCFVDKRFNVLKKHEIRNLTSFCSILQKDGCDISHFDGFFVSYSIAQIGKEFDLLRFGKDYILNIEIKSELKSAQKEAKILKQMKENHYYLKFLGKQMLFFTYVENDGFFQYTDDGQITRVTSNEVARNMCEQTVDYSIDPDALFLPSNYLISPFNRTHEFMRGDYFLTSAQAKVKEETLAELEETPLTFFCLSANAGTGKTLLMYDIAKTLYSSGKRVLIIHCGMLNQGHIILKAEYGWDILSIRDISKKKEYISLDSFDLVFIDESQRIQTQQLSALIERAIQKNKPLFFSFDTRQYLRSGETLDLGEYLKENYPRIRLSKKTLTNTIRTNKAISSFITNLFEKGKSHDNLNYECVSIDYYSDYEMAKEYVAFLRKNGWTAITYTTSSFCGDPFDKLKEFSETNAHNVIGQEFSKVVFVMNSTFLYGENGTLLLTDRGYYSAHGMLYQIVTRVVNELKIIVLDNPKLYLDLLEIKALSSSS